MVKDETNRKRIIIFSVAAIILAVLVFIGGFYIIKNLRENYEKYKPDQITGTIVENMKYTDLVKVDKDQVSKHYSIPDGTVSDWSLYMSKSSDSASELTCFLLKDSSKYDELKNAVTDHLNSKAAGFKSLNPTQYEALKTAVIAQNGRYVLVAVGNNTAAAEKLFNGLVSG